MMADDTFVKVKQIIVNQLRVEAPFVTLESSFTDDLCADSSAQVELVMAFERAFDISIPEEEADKIKTVGDAVNIIDEITAKIRSDERRRS
jgi:acyl carrier protein